MSTDRIAATATPIVRTVRRPRPADRGFRSRRRPDVDLVLAWTDPLVTGPLRTPRGLALGNAGRRGATDVVIDVPTGPQIATRRLRRNGRILVASLDEPGTIAATVAVGVVFVDWTDRRGERRSAWLRVPPVPSRFAATSRDA